MLDKTRRSRIHSTAGLIGTRAVDPGSTGRTATNTVQAPSVEPATPTYRCTACGHVMRVMGLGRHRVYFDSTDRLVGAPIMDRRCSACGHGLPGK